MATEQTELTQEQKDALAEFDERMAAKRKAQVQAQKAREDELQEQAQAEMAKEAQAALNRYKAEMRGQWLATGGDESEFESAWPEMKARYLERHATQAVSAQRAGMRSMIRNWI